MTFEEQYQAQFDGLREEYPLGSEVFANGKVYKITDYEMMGNKSGVVGIDREGNEKSLYEFEPVQYKVCGRCGGSGRYSYNMQHGSICYGCSGIGKQILAPSGYPQKLVAVCTKEVKGFTKWIKLQDEIKAEFCGFTKSGGTPLYFTDKRVTLMYKKILDCFVIK